MSALAALLLLACAARAGTVVSLHFDDATADQMTAVSLLDARGLKASFYVNSERIGAGSYYLGRAQLEAIAGGGHEIAGHTLRHRSLTGMDEAELREHVCGDRERLVSWGFEPVSFAYPYGAYDARTKAMAAECGYANARSVGGIGCAGCPSAEGLPPPDAFALRTPKLVQSNTTLAELKAYVSAAESSGGGLVALVMHRVCSGCGIDSMTEETLRDFLDWLLPRAALGTVVRTTAQALAAGAPPPPPPPPPPAPPPAVPGAPALSGDLSALRAFPNPWRGDRHSGRPLVVDRLPPGSEVRVYDAAGRLVRTLSAPSGTATWDLADGAGTRVASGLYPYAVSSPAGQRARGTLAVVR